MDALRRVLRGEIYLPDALFIPDAQTTAVGDEACPLTAQAPADPCRCSPRACPTSGSPARWASPKGTIKQHLKELFRRLERAQPHAGGERGAAPGAVAEIVARLRRYSRRKREGSNLPSLFAKLKPGVGLVRSGLRSSSSSCSCSWWRASCRPRRGRAWRRPGLHRPALPLLLSSCCAAGRSLAASGRS